jgi:hypothetical protein
MVGRAARGLKKMPTTKTGSTKSGKSAPRHTRRSDHIDPAYPLTHVTTSSGMKHCFSRIPGFACPMASFLLC